MQTITPGRWRNLTVTSSEQAIFTIMAFDQRGTYQRMLPQGATYEDAVRIKSGIVGALSRYVSAVLLDAEYGLESLLGLSGRSGLLMALEKSGYSGDSTGRKVDFDPAWSVEKINRIGANGVKILTYYHPDSGALAEEIEGVIQRVVEEAHRYDLPVFLEPYSYSIDPSISKESADFAEQRPAIITRTAQRLGRLGVDVLKLEFPYDVAFEQDQSLWLAACEVISAAIDIPWVLLSAGVDFATFEAQTRCACQGGASGYLAGRAIWKEAVTMSETERQQFVSTTAVERIKRLSEIAHTDARPWTAIYQPPSTEATWYKGY
jgi:tagatose 1,6-diphosphate aldolase